MRTVRSATFVALVVALAGCQPSLSMPLAPAPKVSPTASIVAVSATPVVPYPVVADSPTPVVVPETVHGGGFVPDVSPDGFNRTFRNLAQLVRETDSPVELAQAWLLVQSLERRVTGPTGDDLRYTALCHLQMAIESKQAGPNPAGYNDWRQRLENAEGFASDYQRAHHT